MKILMISPHLPQIKTHNTAGMKVTVITTSSVAAQKQDALSRLGINNVDFFSCQQSNIWGVSSIRFGIAARRLTLKNHFDVIHLNALHDLPWVWLFINIFSRNKDVPILVAMGHSAWTWKSSMRSKISAFLIRNFADGFIALSRTQIELLNKLGVKQEKMEFIPNTYDQDWLDDIQKNVFKEKESNQKCVIYVGGLFPSKDQATLIRAFELLNEDFPDLRLILVGGDDYGTLHRKSFNPFAKDPGISYSKYLRSLVEELGLEDNVIFTGKVTHQEVGNMLMKSTIVAFPSRAEVMPRAVIEAMVLGKPVIASGIDGILDLIDDGRSGLLIEPGDVAGLAIGLRVLLTDSELSNQLGAEARKKTLDYCSPRQVGSDFLGFYKKLQL